MKELADFEIGHVGGGLTPLPPRIPPNFDVLERLSAEREFAWIRDMMPVS